MGKIIQLTGTKMAYADPILGSAVRIKRECVKKAINKIKSSKAAWPSSIVVEMLKVRLVLILLQKLQSML